MRKLILFLVIIFFSLNIGLYAQNFKGKTPAPISIMPPEKSLTVGETFWYSVEWLGIPIGSISLEVAGIEDIDGHECYHIIGRALPNRFFIRLYDIEYKVHTYIDTQTLYTRRFEKVRRIRKSFTYVVAEFDQEKDQATYTYYSPQGPMETISFPSMHKKIIHGIKETIKTPPGVQDLLSSLYYFRLAQIDKTNNFSMGISYERKTWPVNVKVEKLFWKDIYKKGTLAVMSVIPDSDLNDAVLGKRNMSVIFTADSRRIPIEFRLNTATGLIRGKIKGLFK